MRKFLYFCMFVLGALLVASLLLFPIYKFDDDKIYQNYSEYEYYLKNGVTEIGIEEKDGVYYIYSARTGNHINKELANSNTFNKDIYNKEIKAIYASMNNDTDLYYNSVQYDVLNTLYNKINPLLPLNPALTSDSTEEALNLCIQSIKNDLLKSVLTADSIYESLNIANTEEHIYFDATLTSDADVTDEIKTAVADGLFEKEKNSLVKSKIETLSAEINLLLGNDENNKEKIALIGTYDVLSGLFLLTDESSAIYQTESTNKYRKNGIKALDLVDSWTNVVSLYRTEFEKEEYENASFIQLATKVVMPEEVYNVWPLALFTVLVLYILFMGFVLIFSSIKGVRGRNKPRLLLSCLIFAAIMFILYSRKLMYSPSLLISFHTVELARLFDIPLFGNFEIPVFCAFSAGLISAFITILGTFCKWSKGKKNNRKNKTNK